MTSPILVFGANGQIATELARLGREQGLEVVLCGRDRLDLGSGADGGEIIDAVRPAAVINAAAYTAVDRAEDEPEIAFALNRDAPGRLARACAARGLPFVHYSTDYVFDGAKGAPYVESDARAPLNLYGLSKSEGEDAALAAGGRSMILRTSWIVGAFGQNFLKTMLRLAETRDEVGVVADQHGRLTWSRDAARAGLEAAGLLAKGAPGGVYHVAGADDAAWADVAEALFDHSRGAGGPYAAVRRITTAEYPTRARRAAYSGLDSSRFAGLGAWRSTPWRDALAAAFADIQTQNSGDAT